MRLIQKVISAGFAACALASASLPALSWTVWPDVDFEWYANVGKPMAGAATLEVFPAPREGLIWSPGRYERTAGGRSQAWVPGRWIADDYRQQVATYAAINAGTTVATGPLALHDRDGNVIPTHPDAYPVDSTRR